MSKEIIQFDDAMFESKLDRMVRGKVEQTINLMLDEEANQIANAARYERSSDWKAFRAGQLLWGERMSSQTLIDKLKKVYEEIDQWRNRPLGVEWLYVFVGGVWYKRSRDRHVENVSARRHRR